MLILEFSLLAAAAAGLAVLYRSLVRRFPDRTYRLALALVFATAFFLFWSNAAVGIVGDEGQAVNDLFHVVLGIALVGALVVRFRPKGLAYVLVMAAVVHTAIAAYALTPSGVPGASPIEVIVLNGFFVGAWLLAALGFLMTDRRSERT